VSVVARRLNAHLLVDDQKLDCLEIKISDTGVGIPPDQMAKIFQRFYRVEKDSTTSTSGAGIGLALTRDLVELHYGKIVVSSTVHQGTTFSIYLPIGKTHLKESEVATEFIQLPEPSFTAEVPAKIASKRQRDPEKPMILIVEDNIEMRFYLHSVLRRQYQVEEATNGQEALDFVLSKNPDVIVSDIMMPVMDGINLCKAIKADIRFNHIPVILLTARAAETDRIKGLKIGANDYIVKPFHDDVLKARIHNILEDRQKMRERIRKELLMQPELHEEMSEDERLINRAKEIVQQHLDDFDFTIKDFAGAMALSRSYLNRKMQAIVGMSASRFIREIRLTTAAHLIESHKGNVTEIAMDVGFDNFAYFTRCFKEKYGRPPSKYAGQKNLTSQGRES
jgi:DNA-binding response OmpR family regulator